MIRYITSISTSSVRRGEMIMTRDEKVMAYQRGQANCYREIGELVDQLCDSILKESEVLGDDEANRRVVLSHIDRIRKAHKMLLEA